MNELIKNELSLVFGGDDNQPFQSENWGYCDVYDKNTDVVLARCYLPPGIASDYVEMISKLSFGWGSQWLVDCQPCFVYEEIE